MAIIYDVPTNELIEKLAEELKNIEQIKPPQWAGFVKTGTLRKGSDIRNGYLHQAALIRPEFENHINELIDKNEISESEGKSIIDEVTKYEESLN